MRSQSSKLKTVPLLTAGWVFAITIICTAACTFSGNASAVMHHGGTPYLDGSRTIRAIYPFTQLFRGKHTPAKKPSSFTGRIDGFEDSADFVLYAKDYPIGVISTSLDKRGNYRRVMTLSMAGQNVEMTMTATPGKTGRWETIELKNPALGDIRVARDDSCARYSVKNEPVVAKLPADYVLYDDYGVLFESIMIGRYDMKARGRQTFTRFRIPETVPGNIITVDMEYSGEEKVSSNGRTLTLRKFEYSALGQRALYRVGPDSRIYMSEDPASQMYMVRKGYEDLARLRETGTSPSPKKGDVVKKTVMVPMRDGAKLATDLFVPARAAGRLPVVLIRTPYGKEMNELDGMYYARRGYVAAIQDVRGRFASEGAWEPIVNEGDDGFDTVEWLAAQEWSTGKVGMIGASYLGWTQLLAAVRKPPHLAAIIPNVTPPDPMYNIPYEYGVFFLYGAAWWLGMLESEATADLSMKTAAAIDARVRTLADSLGELPVSGLDRMLFGREVPIWRSWTASTSRDAFRERGSYLDRLKDVDIPVFLQSGWFDGDGIGSKLAWGELQKSGKRNIRLVLGPWGHTDQAAGVQTGRDFGKEASINLQDLYDRWLDRWLKGEKNGIEDEPRVQVYLMNARKWVKVDSWPLPETAYTKLYLSSNAGANTLGGDGRLSWTPPSGGKPYDEYTYDPADPTPAWVYRTRLEGRAGYERVTSSRRDILVFDSAPFDRPVTIAGPLSAVLYASTSAVDTDWFVTLIALPDKGSPLPLGNQFGKGCLRARFRNSVYTPELLEPGKPYGFTIDLWHTGVTIPAGWRLRVEITSAFFPYFSRNLNTGGDNETERVFKKAEQRIFHSPEYPSHILLPVIQE